MFIGKENLKLDLLVEHEFRVILVVGRLNSIMVIDIKIQLVRWIFSRYKC